MNQRDLECFVRVVDAGSFIQAATLLGRPQPPPTELLRIVKAQVRALDGSFGWRPEEPARPFDA